MISNVNELLLEDVVHGFLDLLSLNMRNMRSVIRNPPTMLLKAAATATAPRTVESVLSMPAGDDDGRHHHNRVQSVGEGHQRRVQQRRDSPDHFESDEARQHEYVQAVDEIECHKVPPKCQLDCDKMLKLGTVASHESSALVRVGAAGVYLNAFILSTLTRILFRPH